MCLDCSGWHRRLGVHLSFVRSANMDQWTLEQMQMMRYGGNKAAKEYFRSRGISELSGDNGYERKYNSSAARQYNAKLKKLVAEQGSRPRRPQVRTAVLGGQGPDPHRVPRGGTPLAALSPAALRREQIRLSLIFFRSFSDWRHVSCRGNHDPLPRQPKPCGLRSAVQARCAGAVALRSVGRA